MRHLKMIIGFILLGSLAQAQLTDEVIVDSNVTGRDWNAEIAANNDVWLKPTCSAYTVSADGNSSLEVIAYYDQASDSFSEPEVNVITTANLSFLDVTVSTDRSSRNFQMLPVQPTDTTVVGARVLFDDREDLTSAIRRHNRLVARYLDSAGEVRAVQFSLRGSSAAIQAAFNRCELEFRESLDLPAPI